MNNNMLNLKYLIYWKKHKKKIKINSADFDEIRKFYTVLLKYKKRHPYFNIKFVMLKVYPNLDWKQFSTKLEI